MTGIPRFDESESAQDVAGREPIVWPHQEIDVGRYTRAGFREVAIRGVHALEQADVDPALGQRASHALELFAQAAEAPPAMVQVDREQIRDPRLSGDATGLAPVPHQRADPTRERRNAERARPAGGPAEHDRARSVAQHRTRHPPQLPLGRPKDGQGDVGPEVPRVARHVEPCEPPVDLLLWFGNRGGRGRHAPPSPATAPGPTNPAASRYKRICYAASAGVMSVVSITSSASSGGS